MTELKIGIIAFVYSVLCTEGGMIFNRPYLWLQSNLPDYLYKPLIGCEKCVAGQMAFWYYIINNYKSLTINSWFEHIQHIAYSCSLSILIVYILSKANSWAQQF
jgi:hypothetical protein